LAVFFGENRYYDLNKIPKEAAKVPEHYKIKMYNITLFNRMQLPIKLERIQFDREAFKQHWNRHVGGGGYIFPLDVRE
jgi:hypothetical protein